MQWAGPSGGLLRIFLTFAAVIARPFLLPTTGQADFLPCSGMFCPQSRAARQKAIGEKKVIMATGGWPLTGLLPDYYERQGLSLFCSKRGFVCLFHHLQIF